MRTSKLLDVRAGILKSEGTSTLYWADLYLTISCVLVSLSWFWRCHSAEWLSRRISGTTGFRSWEYAWAHTLSVSQFTPGCNKASLSEVLEWKGRKWYFFRWDLV